MSAPVEFKYRAFLSYAHADARWGTWLHRSLEGFRIADDLAGRQTLIGPVPRSLRPIFRDRDDFTGGHTLGDATIAALDQSAALIVLCSTVAATRPAVNEEVRLFRSRHPDRPVIPVIIEGVAPDNFPPALRVGIAADGNLTDQAVTILGPDLREEGDGRSLGLAKIVAGLTGVGTDEIARRAEREQQRRLRNWVAGLSTVAVALAGLAAWAEINRRDAVEQRKVADSQRQIADQRRQEAERNFALAKGAADGLVVDIAQGLRNVEGMRATTVAKILGTARGTFDKLVAAAPDNRELQRGRTVMLIEFGDTHRAQGNLPAALESYREAVTIRDRMVKSEPANAQWRRDLGVSHNRLGNVLRDQGNLSAALEAFKAGLVLSDQLAKEGPGNVGWQYDLGISNERIGDILFLRGELAEALASYRAKQQILTRLSNADPGNARWKRDLSVALNKIGDVLFAQNALADALQAYTASRTIDESLVAVEPENTMFQRDLSISHEKVGNALTAQGDHAGALDAFNALFTVRNRLARTDPGNAGWQRDLSVAHGKIGDAQFGKGNFPAALDAYNASLTIRDALVRRDPGNAGWQRDLSVAHNKIGDTLVAEGRFSEAFEPFNASLAIRQRLVESAPGNAMWQLDIVASLVRLSANQALIDAGETAAGARISTMYQDLNFALKAEQARQYDDLVRTLFKTARRTDRPRRLLEEARQILLRQDAEKPLSMAQRQWLSLVQSGLATLP